MDIKAIEKEMERLVSKLNKDSNDLNACTEYLKLYESVTYLESCGFLELSFHRNDTFHLYKDYATVARIRLGR